MKVWTYLFSYRRLIVGSVRSDLRSKYAGSALGMGWFFLTPLIFLLFYSAVYLLIFNVRPIGLDRFSYVCHILAGILPFLAFSEALAAGTQSLSSSRDIFKNTVFPPEILVAKAVFAAHAQLIVGLVILLGVCLYRFGLRWEFLLLPVVLMLQCFFLLGLIWILSLTNLVFRDLQNVIGFLSMALMVASPIAYTPEMVPENLRLFLWLNPVAHFILIYQSIVVTGTLPPLSSLATVIALSTLSLSVGYWVFTRMKKVVANYA